MKVYECGEVCQDEGVFWSELILDNGQSFDAVKACFVAKFELNVQLTTDALDEGFAYANDHDVSAYVNDHLIQKYDDMRRLSLARAATTLDELRDINLVFIKSRDVAEYAGCDYWSLLASKAVSDTVSTISN